MPQGQLLAVSGHHEVLSKQCCLQGSDPALHHWALRGASLGQLLLPAQNGDPSCSLGIPQPYANMRMNESHAALSRVQDVLVNLG